MKPHSQAARWTAQHLVSLCLALHLALASAGSKGSKAWSITDLYNMGSGETGVDFEDPKQGPLQVVQCINEVYQEKKMTWAMAMKDDLAALKVIGLWWSRHNPNVPATLVTQLTVNRLPQLQAQCMSWHGPLSAAVYVHVQQDVPSPLSRRNAFNLQKAVKTVENFHKAMESNPLACKLDIMLVYELFIEPRATLLYPVNVLRNLARLSARTDVLALMDVDMLVSSKIIRDLEDPVKSQRIVERCRNNLAAYVMPAFETYGNMTHAASIADNLVTRSKANLIQVRAGAVLWGGVR